VLHALPICEKKREGCEDQVTLYKKQAQEPPYFDSFYFKNMDSSENIATREAGLKTHMESNTTWSISFGKKNYSLSGLSLPIISFFQ
jgi:hypothetical protein